MPHISDIGYKQRHENVNALLEMYSLGTCPPVLNDSSILLGIRGEKTKGTSRGLRGCLASGQRTCGKCSRPRWRNKEETAVSLFSLQKKPMSSGNTLRCTTRQLPATNYAAPKHILVGDRVILRGVAKKLLHLRSAEVIIHNLWLPWLRKSDKFPGIDRWKLESFKLDRISNCPD